MRAPRLLVVLLLLGCSAASIPIESQPESVAVPTEPSPQPLPREFMGVPFGASLEVVQEATRELACNPLKPDDAAGHEVLFCAEKVKPEVIFLFFRSEGDRLRFVGGVHSTYHFVPAMAEARYSAILKAKLKELGKPSEGIEEPGQQKAVWRGEKVTVSLSRGTDDKRLLVVYTAVTKEFGDLRFSL